VNSPSQLLEILIANGADVDKFVKVVRTGKFRRYATDRLQHLRSATLQVFGELDAVITIHFKELLKTDRVGDLAITAKGQWQQEMHCDLYNMKNTRVALWQAISVELDLSQIFALLGDFGKILPKVKIGMDYQQHMGIYFAPFNLDYQIVLGVSFHLECKGLIDIVNAIADVISFVGSHINSNSLKREMDTLKRTINAICSGKHRLSVSIRFNGGFIDAHETYIAYNSNKLRLSSLPTCPSVNGTPLGGKCVKNSDCWSDEGKYNDGRIYSKYGYCKNHNTWKTTLGCFGRCIKKLRGGESCSKSRLNSPPWEHLDVTSAEHAACQSGKCLCDTCAEVSNRRLRDNKKCSFDWDCGSWWCEGRITASCNGWCKPKRGSLASAYCDALGCIGRSCIYGKEVCGKCTKSNRRVPNNYKCTSSSDCESGWCQGRVTISCNGWCKPKGGSLASSYCDGLGCMGESCVYGKEVCGKCTKSNRKVSNGYKCSFTSDCESGYCEGRPTISCNGRCRAKRGHLSWAWCDWLGCRSESCQSNKEICRKCTKSSRRMPDGEKCSGHGDCESGYCEGRVTSFCNGRCRRKREGGESPWCDWLRCESSSCRYGKEICRKCVWSNHRIHHGSCSHNGECNDRSCRPKKSNWWSFGTTIGCSGKC